LAVSGEEQEPDALNKELEIIIGIDFQSIRANTETRIYHKLKLKEFVYQYIELILLLTECTTMPNTVSCGRC
jgi:hypothetical protein